MHMSSMDEMREFRMKHLAGREAEPLSILDVGSMNLNGTYRTLFDERAWEYVGLDMDDGPNVDLVARSPYAWAELAGESFDVVISGQALEHIEFPWLTMQEIARVLKLDGLCCLIAPASGGEHRFPVDCWRFYPDGFRALARYAGLEVVSVVTHWQARGYPDESDLWMDTVMVCRKPWGLARITDRPPRPNALTRNVRRVARRLRRLL